MMAMFFAKLLLGLASISCFLAFAARLPADEVESLQIIANSLGKKDWDFSVDPCSKERGWASVNATKENANAVTCNCTFDNNTVCHVFGIILKRQDLSGTVPPQFARLPFLQEIDLSGNYLNGSIPQEWGSLKLVNISLLGNRLTGPIPKELGNISTLKSLVLEFNQLSGTIPPELGNLSSIQRLYLTSNYLTGELPETLSNLTTLKDLRIGDNNFVGNIPNFIQKWTNIESLVIQASGLSGPIPFGIASLTKLIDLRISDLKGNDSNFPPLNDAKGLVFLILRSCRITGLLPSYIGSIKELRVLDLSFNKLSGHIPDDYATLSGTKFIYLTGNSLTGPVPNWVLINTNMIDLSYNNLTLENTEANCRRPNLNLFASSKGNTSGVDSCLSSSGCKRKYHNFHINCGGGGIVDHKRNYEQDETSGAAATFFRSSSNWAFSSTGHFLDHEASLHIAKTASQISPLYLDARRSPLSLTYYGFCLLNGSYRVDLHFAEIMFASNGTSSLGRRVFDVYIQENQVLKDFNIEEAAGGVNKPITINFTAAVTDSTLSIRFFWAGKGTTSIPSKGVYGPLISAISVESADYKPPRRISSRAIVGIVLGVLVMMLLLLGILWRKGCLRRKDSREHDLKGVHLHTGSFSLRQIKAATNNFDSANKIGEGGFGPVYKGLLPDGSMIAVKQLSSRSNQGDREFVNEIGMISALQHPHLVKLLGCCVESNQLLLVYEYLVNNSLARALFGEEEEKIHLNWPTRRKICIGIARGLAFLHEESRLKIVHRDIKATNVLLDKNLSPKISDFGLAKLHEGNKTHISTRVAGTFGYMAPEYAMRGYLTDKADVYSFGVVVLEIVCGRSNTSFINPDEDYSCLLDWANYLKEHGNLMELADPRMESEFDKEEVIEAINIGIQCAHIAAAERPSMSAVVSMFEGRVPVVNSSVLINQVDLKETSLLIDASWTTSSSTSTADLYPITLPSDLWERNSAVKATTFSY